MLTEAKNLLEKSQDLMNLCMGQILDKDMLCDMSSEEFEMYKKLIDLMECSKSLVLEQARLMDAIDAKLDRVTFLLENKQN